MKFFDDTIDFNRKLIENEYCIITYTGNLFKNNSNIVSIVYGYGENWTHTTEQKMTKTENGFVVHIKLLENFNMLYFCFKNSNNEWDNNNNQNYWAPIEKQSTENAFIINENVINNILDNLVSIDLKSPDKNNTNNEEIVPFDVEVETEKPLDIEETLVNVTSSESLNNDIENLFAELYNNEEKNSKQDLLDNILSTPKQEDTNKVENINSTNQDSTEKENKFNVNSLIDEILSPIVSSSVFEEENIDDLKNFKVKENQTVQSNFENIEPKIDTTADEVPSQEVTKPVEEAIEDTNTIIEESSVPEQKIDISNIDFVESEDNLKEDFNLNDKIDSLITELYNKAMLNTYTNDVNSQTDNIELEDSPKSNVENLISNENNINDIEEESLMDVLNVESDEKNETSLIEVKNDNFIVSARSLGKFYLLKKKIKLALYKLFFAIPRLLKNEFGENKNN